MDYGDEDDYPSYYNESDNDGDDDAGIGSDNDDAINDDVNNDVEDHNQLEITKREKHYTILNEAEIKRLQDVEISEISSLLSLSYAESCVLLCHYNWSTDRLQEDWFTDEQKVRAKVGLFIKSLPNLNNNNNFCGICLNDDLSADELLSTNCGHYFCKTCWGSYIYCSIYSSGSGCLLLRCPEPKCPAAVDRDMVAQLTSKESQKKYLGYLIRSFVEFKKMNIKWCPSPGCNNAIKFIPGIVDYYDVVCECEHEFCLNCGEEPHRPVDCNFVKEWTLKNSSEAENTKWIMAYSKPCPKCKRPIEKNTGCNHMTCGAPCGHHFCWLCAGSLDTGSHYTCHCNRYNGESQKSNTQESQREMAKRSIVRYTHYYERWASNNKSRDKALSDMIEMKSAKIELLSEKLKTTVFDLEFIIKAWEQIVECRRILKWTYAYGFFFLEHENTKRRLFEYLQGEAEMELERLHSCAERELKAFFGDDNGDEKAFLELKGRLTTLTSVTGSHFENLLRGIENDLSEVVVSERVQEEVRQVAAKLEAQERNNNVVANQQVVYWPCDICTYLNPEGATSCEMCTEAY